MEIKKVNKIFLITDRQPTLSDSISRYIIDLAEGFALGGKDVRIYTTAEAKREDYSLPSSVKFINGLPKVNEDAIYHFHLTFSIRSHTKFLIDNLAKLAKKSIVTLHVTPEYAEIMNQKKEMETILTALAYSGILVHSFSNYAKYDLKRFMISNCKVVYPGLNLGRYQKFLRHTIKKENEILVVASNPDSSFVKEVKGFNFLEVLEKKYKNMSIKRVVNLPFEEYLIQMAKAKFYVALSRIEHYGLAIIDAYNLFTIPIYSNEGGLTEAIYGNGVPIFVNGNIVMPEKLDYNPSTARENLAFSMSEHTIEKHIRNMENLYDTLIL